MSCLSVSALRLSLEASRQIQFEFDTDTETFAPTSLDSVRDFPAMSWISVTLLQLSYQAPLQKGFQLDTYCRDKCLDPMSQETCSMDAILLSRR